MSYTQKSTQGINKITSGGENTTPVTFTQIAAGVVVIKAAPGILCNVLITTTLTTGQGITFYDNSSAGSGTIIGQTATGATAGTLYSFQTPAALGITIAQNASLLAGGITVSFV